MIAWGALVGAWANCSEHRNPQELPDDARDYAPKRWAARVLALAASASRFLGGAAVSSEPRRRLETAAISSIAAWNAASLALDGLWKPVILRTNCREAA